MAAYVVHRDINNGTYNFRAGDTFDDASINPATFRAAGGKCSLDQDDTAETAASITLTGDIDAAGGFRRDLVFTAPGAAGVLAADQTNLDCRLAHTVTAAASSYVAKRPGSITGISGQLSAAITGSSKTCVISATVNGTEVACSATFTTGGAEVTKYAVVAKDALPYVAGDVIGMSYTTTTITNTPALVGSVEVEE